MCAGKHNFFGAVPIAIVLLGIFQLSDFYFIHTSSFVNAAVAVMLCGLAAPAVQSIIIVVQNKNVKLIVADIVLIITALLVLFLGEYVVTEVFKVKVVKYLYDPGRIINTVSAIIESIAVAVIAILSKKRQICKSLQNN